jgi:hypothetical protein
VLIEAAFVVERHRTPLEQRISAGNTGRGVAQRIAGQAVVAIAVRADNLNHTFEHFASGSISRRATQPAQSCPLQI